MNSSNIIYSMKLRSFLQQVRTMPLSASILLGAAILAPTPALQAQVLYSGIRDIVIPADFDGVYLDLDTGTSSTSATAGWDLNPFFGGYAIANKDSFQPVRLTSAVDGVLLNLAQGTSVGPGSTFATGDAGSEGHIRGGGGQFAAGSEGYIGFKFTPEGGAGPYYGWMRMVVTVNEPGGLIRDWAYDTTGAPLGVGGTAVVPEPASMVIAGLALVGLGAWQRMRR